MEYQKLVHLDIVPVFKVGDSPPNGYVAWYEWAKVQHRGGLRQQRCDKCGLLEFPQEKCREKANA